jgi:NlpC/P60 family putative phage cell wall peptidase
MSPREALIAEILLWIGTPFVKDASLRGVGADCAGLIHGVWREGFSTSYPQRPSRETSIETAAATLLLAQPLNPAPADILLFAPKAGEPATHAGFITDATPKAARFVHAHWGQGVVESRFGAWWAARLVGVYSFPETQSWPR